MDIKFLCLNGTVFDQETRVCERVDEVDCSKSERFYYLNLELYGNTMIPSPDGKLIECFCFVGLDICLSVPKDFTVMCTKIA